MTMVDWQIRECIKDGSIVIRRDYKDFDESRLIGPNSVDVTLGRHFWRVMPNKNTDNFCALNNMRFKYEKRDEAIKLKPRERLLGITEEFVGGTVDINRTYAVVAHMHARSSTGRYGITTNLCAGFGDVGYVNRWTMEICNLNDFDIEIPVGMKIAQMEFQKVAIPLSLYAEKSAGAQYQSVSDISQVISSWNPISMIPTQNRDKAII